MGTRIHSAMVFAAGFGVRLKPLTDRTPKPLLQVGGRSMLDRVLDRLQEGGVQRAVVNTHHLAAQVHDAVWARRKQGRGPEVVLVHEEPILETGGGLVRALGLLGGEPFLSVNADVVWLEGAEPAVSRLAAHFDPQCMDALLLLQPVASAVGYRGEGDFALDGQGGLVRPSAGSRPFVFTGVQIWHPRAFLGCATQRFSLSDIYQERVRGDGRLSGLFGLVHDGQWLHVGTEPDLRAADRHLSRG